jgi:hypothetical protein
MIIQVPGSCVSAPALLLRRQTMEDYITKRECYINSLKDKANNRHVLGEATIIKKIGDNLYLADYNGVRCTAIFNYYVNAYFVDDVYGIVPEGADYGV